MLDGDRAAIRMAYSLAFSLPGTPVLFYGEEIGMAENLEIEGRYSVRSPMQWSAERHGGFSHGARAGRSCARPLDRRPLRARARQRHRPAPRPRLAPELVRAPHPPPPRVPRDRLRRRSTVLDAGAPSVLAHRCDWEGSTIVAVHELAGEAVEVRLPVDDGEALVDLFGDDEHPLPASLGLARTRRTGSACGARA